MPSASPLGVHSLLAAAADVVAWEPGGAAGSGGVLGTWPTNPPDPRLVGPDAVSASMQTALEEIVSDFADMRIAVLDMAADPPRLALWRPDEPVLIASMGKLAILYAAFQLREDVRTIARAFSSVRTAGAVDAELRRAWAADASTRLSSIADSRDIARLEFIFDFSPIAGSARNPDAIDFLGAHRCGLDDLRQDFSVDSETVALARRLEALPHFDSSAPKLRTIAEMKFAERLWMTTAWSDNVAASTCIWDVGLGYIQALMYDSGLFTDERAGVWLKRTFNETLPAGHGTRFGASPSRFTSPAPGLKKQTGTARALASLLIALAKDSLISVQASRQMKRLLRPLDRITVEGAEPDPYFGLASRIDGALTSDASVEDGFFKAGLYDTSHPPFATLCEAGAFELRSPLGTSGFGLVLLGASSRLPDPGQRSRKIEGLIEEFVKAATVKFGW